VFHGGQAHSEWPDIRYKMSVSESLDRRLCEHRSNQCLANYCLPFGSSK